MTKLGKQSSTPNVSGVAFKPVPVKNARLSLSANTTSGPMTVTSSVSPTGTLLHTCTSYAHDEIFLWASNHATSANHELKIEIGGDGTFSDNNKTFVISLAKRTGLTQIYPGVPHKDVTVYALADADNVINVYGYVDRHYRIDLADESLGYDAGLPTNNNED